MRILILILAASVLAGCAGTPKIDPNFQAYADAHAEAARQLSVAVQRIADPAGCGDARCAENRAAMAAMALVAGGGAGRSPIQQRQPDAPHPAWTVAAAVLPSVAGGAVQAVGQRYARDTTVAQYEFLGGAIGALAGSSALQPPAAPNITVGGDYIPGSQHHGDTVGGNWTGRDAVGRDNIGRDQRTGDDTRTNWGTGNRFESPGPFRDNGNGPRCDGANCQPVNPPPPDDPDGP